MKYRTWATPACAALLAFMMGGCGPGRENSLPPIGAAAITPESLWRRIEKESPYSGYSPWPEHRGVQMGQSPHGRLHRIYINDAIAEALPIQAKQVPEGGLIVMENLDSESRLQGISVMAKAKGFDPQNGDWFWASYDSTGKASASGSVRSCIICHAGMESNDYVIVRRLDAPLK